MPPKVWLVNLHCDQNMSILIHMNHNFGGHMPSIDRKPLYQQLGLLKVITNSESQYSAIPEGDLDVDRLIRAQPAFQSHDDSTLYKKKKIVVYQLDRNVDDKDYMGYRSESNATRLKRLRTLRQLFLDGFEIYNYHHGHCHKKISGTLSNALHEHSLEETPIREVVHQVASEDIGTSYDDIIVLDQKSLDEVTEQLVPHPETLWLTDILTPDKWNDDYINTDRLMSAIDTLKTTWEQGTARVVVNFWLDDPRYLVILQKKFGALPLQRTTQIFTTQQLMQQPDFDLSQLEKVVLKSADYHDIKFDATHLAYLLENSPQLTDLTIINDLKPMLNALTIHSDLDQLASIEINGLQTTHAEISSLLRHSPQLKELTLMALKFSLPLTIDYPSLDKLQRLSISADFPSPSTIGMWIKNMPELTYLKLDITPTTGKPDQNNFDERYWPNNLLPIEELDLSKTVVTNKQLKILLRTMPHLKKLNVAGCQKLDSNETKGSVPLNELEELNLAYSTVTGALLADLLKSTPKLKDLYLHNCNTLNEGACAFEADLSSLVYMRLDSSNIQSQQLASLLKNARQLKSLDLNDYKELQADSTVFDVNLASLTRFTSNNALTKHQIFSMLQHTKKLEYFNLLQFTLTMDDLKNQVFTLPLKHVEHFKSPASITDNTFMALLAYMPQLKKLDLSQNQSPDNGLPFSASIGSVEELYLQNTKTSARQLATILRTATHLQKLSLNSCQNLTDPAGAFSAPLTALLSIELSFSKITDQCLLSLLQSAPNINTINCGHCTVEITSPQVTEQLKALFQKLKEKFPKNIVDPDYPLPPKPQMNPTPRNTFRPAPEIDMRMGENTKTQERGAGNSKSEGNNQGSNQSGENQGTGKHPTSKQQQTMSNTQTRSLDANTAPSSQSFHLKKIFHALTPGESDPQVVHYRLSSFNHIEDNPNECTPDIAFMLSNQGDLALSTPSIQFSSVDVKALQSGIAATETIRYYGKTQLQLDQNWVALPSLSAAERITHLHANIDPSLLDVQYSARDNRYYIRLKSGEPTLVALDFLLEEDRLQPHEPMPDSVQALLIFCKQFKASPLVMSEKHPTGRDYRIALVAQQTGSCRHRSYAFKALMEDASLREQLPKALQAQLKSLPSYPVRIINNDCHSFVEVCVNHHWVKADLGGYPGNVNVEEDTLTETLTLTEDSHLQPVEAPVEEQGRDYFPETASADDTISLLQYMQKCTQPDADKLLVLANEQQAAQLKFHLQSHCHNTSKSVFYVHEPDDLMCQLPYAEIKPDGHGELKNGPGGPMTRFLMAPNNGAPRVIIVNFNHFPANKLASFNSLLDEPPSIDGIPLPSGTKIIGLLDPQKPQDASFYSRFAGHISECPKLAKTLETPKRFEDIDDELRQRSNDVVHIDCHDSTFWKSTLLGNWSLEGQQLTYQYGPLIQALSKTPPPKTIVLNNAPLNNERFQQFWQHAQLTGWIEYEDQRIAFPKDTRLIHQSGYPFDADVIVNVSYEPPTKAMPVLNSHLLSGFLKKYEYRNNEHSIYHIEGLLQEHQRTTPDEPFSIYLSESMSPSNWSLLVSACLAYNIKLSITLSPSATLPSPLDTTYPKPEHPVTTPNVWTSTSTLSATQAIVSHDRDVTLSQLQQTLSNPMYIDVTELNASELLLKLDGTFNQDTLKFEFNQYQGALLKALSEGKTVVLHGTFSDELRHRLSTLLMERHFARPDACNGQLIIVSEDESIQALQGLLPIANHEVSLKEKKDALRQYAEVLVGGDTSSLKLNTIDPKKSLVEQCAILRYRLQHPTESSKADNGPWLGLEKNVTKLTPVEPLNLDKAPLQADALDKQRLDLVDQTLQYAPFVILTGISGTGKTTFVEQIWQNKASGRTLYIADTKNKASFQKTLRAWAEDNSPGQKALFIDEANITQEQWSQFEGLLNHPPAIMIGNEYVTLSPNHKVIFAGNPSSYSDDRQVPSLFKRHGNSVLFEPLSPAYIWQRMLSSVFLAHQRLDLGQPICTPIFAVNQWVNAFSTTDTLLSPRELIMMSQLSLSYCSKHPDINPSTVAAYYAYSLARPLVPKAQLEAFDAQFKVERPHYQPRLDDENDTLFMTDSNRESANLLDDFLTLRDQAIDAHKRGQALVTAGLGGLTLEGAPGLGKSALVMSILSAQKFTKKTFQENAPITAADKQYYVLPAGFSPKEKEKLLLRAFDEGAVVICDEINTSASMEQLLNRLLMGKNREGNPPMHPGFMLIGTQNPMTMAGRIKPSQATLHRMHYRVIPHYTEKEMHHIVRRLGLPIKRATRLIQQYLEKSATNKKLCFRDVINRTKEDLHALLGTRQKELSEKQLTELALSTSDEVLQAVSLHKQCTPLLAARLFQSTRASVETKTILAERFYNELSTSPTTEEQPTLIASLNQLLLERITTVSDYIHAFQQQGMTAAQADRLFESCQEKMLASTNSAALFITLILTISPENQLLMIWRYKEQLMTFFPSNPEGNQRLEHLLNNLTPANNEKAKKMVTLARYIHERGSKAYEYNLGLFSKLFGGKSRTEELEASLAMMQAIAKGTEKELSTRLKDILKQGDMGKLF